MTKRTKKGDALRFFEQMMLAASWPPDCIVWPFAKNASGYAIFSTPRGRIRSTLVSRVACSVLHGMPPDNAYEAAHTCGAGSLGCVNPAHLVWKTSAENKADQVFHGTRNWGERNGGAKLTMADVREIRRLAASRSKVEIAGLYHVSPSTISLIANGKRWGQV